jgi:hypothetical protein
LAGRAFNRSDEADLRAASRRPRDQPLDLAAGQLAVPGDSSRLRSTRNSSRASASESRKRCSPVGRDQPQLDAVTAERPDLRRDASAYLTTLAPVAGPRDQSCDLAARGQSGSHPA